MRLLVFSDAHLDWATVGVDRFVELEHALDQIIDTAANKDRTIDKVIFLGDLCDPDSGSIVFRCIDAIQRMFIKIARSGVEVIAIAGNHDVIEDGSGRTSLSPLRALRWIPDEAMSFINLTEQPGVIEQTNGIRFVALPFTASSNPYSPAEVIAKIPWPDGVKTVVLSHLTVPGVQPGEETTEMPRGRDVNYPWEALAGLPAKTRESLTLLQGHYHRQQTFEHESGLKMHIPGSLARLTFGEENHTPGFLIVDV